EGSSFNIGLSLGEPSGGLVDVDLDCPEARAAAAVLLPPTGWVWGRSSAPDSHFGYVVADPPRKASDGFTDPIRRGKDARLLERGGTGGQRVFPPSILPGDEAAGKSEEPCVWKTNTQPATVSLPELRTAVRRVAAASLLGRYWPMHSRHDASLALA